MDLKEILQSKKGISIELLLFFLIAVFMTSILGSGLLLYPLALTSIGVRKVEWSDIGLKRTDFTVKNILTGVAIAVVYYFTDQYLINPIASKFAPPGLPEIFNIKGDLPKYLIGLLLSWIIAAFLEEIVFRGYLINRFIDLIGVSVWKKIIIVLVTGIGFGLVHSYQGINGAISAGFIGVFQAITYFLCGKKLTIPIIAHGVFDTIEFTLLFLG